MFSFNATTKCPEITSDEGYEEARSFLQALKDSPFLPDHPVMAAWWESCESDAHNRIIHVNMVFIPKLMQAMIDYLEYEGEWK